MKNKQAPLAIPYVIWMALFVVAPIIMVVVYAFTAADGSFTLANFSSIGDYAVVFGRSFRLALIATLVCLLIGYPISYMMSREGPRFQRVAMVLIMLPMWMNFLLRTYSWISILENNGLLNQLFRSIGVIDLYNSVMGTDIQYFRMIGTSGAVVLGMVYNYLPYMILPLYATIVKIDGRLIEAAEDLGCNSLQTFTKVIFPLSVPGIFSGITMVFVPAVSTFYISQKLGGTDTVLIGDLIERLFKQGDNPNLGAVLSLVLMVLVLVCTGIMNRLGGEEEGGVIV